jgi:inorganic pyrophosphatase
MTDLEALPSRDRKGDLNVVVETPRGSNVKLKYERDTGTFRYSRQLILGLTYPYDWGFVPSTLADDGDALDAMIYHEVGTYPGVVISCRPIGVVRLTQQRSGEGPSSREHNDRLIVVPTRDERSRDITAASPRVRKEIEHFFQLATLMTEKHVRIESWDGPEAAEALILEAEGKYKSRR